MLTNQSMNRIFNLPNRIIATTFKGSRIWIRSILFVYFFIIKRKRLTLRYIAAYAVYAVCALAYLKRSHVFDFDTALVIIAILNSLLFFKLFEQKSEIKEISKSDSIIIPVLFSLIFTVLLPLQLYFSNKMEFPISWQPGRIIM